MRRKLLILALGAAGLGVVGLLGFAAWWTWFVCAGDACPSIEQFAEYTFFTVFQPIVELRTDAVAGYEALTRFADGQPFAERLAAANDEGIGVQLDAALALAALAAANSLPAGAWLAINISPALAAHSGKVAEILGAAPCPLVIDVGDPPELDRLVNGPLGQHMMIFSKFMAEGTKTAGEYAQADGLSLEAFVSTQAAMGLHFIAWTMLSGASGRAWQMFRQAVRRTSAHNVPVPAPIEMWFSETVDLLETLRLAKAVAGKERRE